MPETILRVHSFWKHYLEYGNTLAFKPRFEIINDDDLQRVFDYFIYQSLPPFFPEDRSVGRVKEAIYKFFKTSFNIDHNSFKEIINICLSKDNRRHFEELINVSRISDLEYTA